MHNREKAICKVTLAGSCVNVLLLVFKFLAGIIGGSAAMIADAVHSLSDFLTDVVVLLFVRLSSRPKDRKHDYGYGKYETLATSAIGLFLLTVGIMICFGGIKKIILVIGGTEIEQPGMIAFVAALAGIVLKEWAFRFTVKAGKKYGSSVLVANAWHHRSDALSSIGTAVGIGGAILLGHDWSVLDPIAAVIVSFFIIRTSVTLVRQAFGELLERSLPDETEDEIRRIAEEEPQVSGVHNMRTRRIGSGIAVEMHLRMPGNITLYDSHVHASNIERRLRERFGENTHIGLHVEPAKKTGGAQSMIR
ncbi:cation diffusion facilitator family transporter [Xylanibacter muris]|uniref:Cation transporter n=1 Tax=Xylanibacter muris TaxID=2736290 RepID=A0ABX2AL62_9BACT|nr:cation diffusion facilitator family transporter [Xylanibacter muris]NPD90987.1 cation transporter [Xylanibacter muris]